MGKRVEGALSAMITQVNSEVKCGGRVGGLMESSSSSSLSPRSFSEPDCPITIPQSPGISEVLVPIKFSL